MIKNTISKTICYFNKNKTEFKRCLNKTYSISKNNSLIKPIKNNIYFKYGILHNFCSNNSNDKNLENDSKDFLSKDFQNDIEDIKRKLNSICKFQDTTKSKGFKQDVIEEDNLKSNSDTIDDKNDCNDSESSNEEVKKKPSVLKNISNQFIDLWNKTFPKEKNYDDIMEKSMKKAKEQKSKIKYATEEDIEHYENTTPEWKKYAIELVQDTTINESTNDPREIMKQAIFNLKEKVKQSESFSSLKDTSIYKEYEQFKDDLNVIQTNIRDNISMSYNPAVIFAKDVFDKVTTKATPTQAVKIMRKIIPDFELSELDSLAKFLLSKILTAYYQNNLETIENLTSENACAMFSAIVKSRLERGLECKYKEPLFLEDCEYYNCEIVDENSVKFQFTSNAQEINCLINKEGEVVEGSPTKVDKCYYLIEIMYDDDIEEDISGHKWVVTRLERTGVVEQLI